MSRTELQNVVLSWYVSYLRDMERFSMGEAPIQDIISLVTMTMTVCVTLRMNIN